MHVKVGDLRLPAILIDHLICMKQRAGRAVDRLDVTELNIIRKLKKKK